MQSGFGTPDQTPSRFSFPTLCNMNNEPLHHINSISMSPLYRYPTPHPRSTSTKLVLPNSHSTSASMNMANRNFRSSLARRAATPLLLLAIAMLGITSARVLDEVLPAVDPATPVDTPAAPTPVETPPAAVTLETPPPAPAPLDTPSAATAPAPAAVPLTTACGPAADHPLTFFMHDIVGGSNPSARIVTGIVSNPAVDGQLPFAKPNGAVLPLNGGVPLNKDDKGIINNNNIPFYTGLSGATTGVVQSNGNNVVVNGAGAGSLPFFTGGNLPAGTALQKLIFGTMTVIDDDLTEGHEKGSGVVGKAQGFYIASSEDGTSQTMAFTAMFNDGRYADSLSFFGVHRTVDSESHVAVVGGTGKYVNAKGFATLRVLPPVDHIDGVETLLQIEVKLA